jgi:hypothetical protein
MGSEARRVAESLGWERIAEQLEGIFLALLDENGRILAPHGLRTPRLAS